MEGYINRAAAFAQSAAQLSRIVSENIVENASEFRLDGQDAAIFDTAIFNIQELDKLLNSSSDRDKLNGLKKLIAMISKGQDASEAFAGVVKNVASSNLEIRKLVYIYLLRYAEQEPDLALLSINTFQKDLSDPSPVIRALALRVMSGIRVKMISPIVLLAIRSAVTDLSPYVRKSAAFAIIKLYGMDLSQKDALIDVLRIYLNDKSHIGLGGVIMSFNTLCPNRFDLIHPHFRKLCNLITEFDEWSQISTIDLLLRYSRVNFLNPNNDKNKNKNKSNENLKSFYDENQVVASGYEIDRDHALLLKSVEPLLASHNSSVVLSTASLYYHIAPIKELMKVGKPLVRLLRSHQEIQYIVLTNIATICSSFPNIFEPYLSSFFIRSGDIKLVRDLKLRIATEVVTTSTLLPLLRELKAYTKSYDDDLVAGAIQAMGRCTSKIPTSTSMCLRILMELMEDKNLIVVGESITVIKQLLQSLDSKNDQTPYLLHLLFAFHNSVELLPTAKAAIIWLIGQYANLVSNYASDVLRVAIKSFKEEDEIVKKQTLSLAIKLLTLWPEKNELSQMIKYLLTLARYDKSYDLRDRARFLQGFINLHNNENEELDNNSILKNHLSYIFLSNKPLPSHQTYSYSQSKFVIGSASLQLNTPLKGYEPLPDWPEDKPDGTVRNVNLDEGEVKPKNNVKNNATSFNPSNSNVKKGNLEDLDAFYEEEEEEEEASSGLEEEETESEEETEESEEETEESEEDSEEESEEESESDEEQEKASLMQSTYHKI